MVQLAHDAAGTRCVRIIHTDPFTSSLISQHQCEPDITPSELWLPRVRSGGAGVVALNTLGDPNTGQPGGGVGYPSPAGGAGTPGKAARAGHMQHVAQSPFRPVRG